MRAEHTVGAPPAGAEVLDVGREELAESRRPGALLVGLGHARLELAAQRGLGVPRLLACRPDGGLAEPLHRHAGLPYPLPVVLDPADGHASLPYSRSVG